MQWPSKTESRNTHARRGLWDRIWTTLDIKGVPAGGWQPHNTYFLSILVQKACLYPEVGSRSGYCFKIIIEWCVPGAHHPERLSPIASLRDNLCPDWAIFRIVSRERLSPLQSAYDRNQGRMGQKWLRRMRDFALVAILFSVDFGHIRTAVDTEVRRKHISKNSSIWA